jgi:hypothetical protein
MKFEGGVSVAWMNFVHTCERYEDLIFQHNSVIRSVGGCVISGGFGEEFLTGIRATRPLPAI